jgi:hypothetical protein
MATIEITCQKCEGNFELESTDVADGSEPLECPHCENKLTKATQEDLSSALADLLAQVAAISKKFTLTFEVDSDELSAVEEAVDDDEEGEEEDDDEDDDDDDDEDDDEDDAEADEN